MKNIKNILFVILFSLLSCSGDIEQEKKLFEKIKIGMTTKDVIGILGKPDDITYSIVDSSEFCYYFFTKNKSGLRSSLPSVNFDKNNKATIIDYGEK